MSDNPIAKIRDEVLIIGSGEVILVREIVAYDSIDAPTIYLKSGKEIVLSGRVEPQLMADLLNTYWQKKKDEERGIKQT